MAVSETGEGAAIWSAPDTDVFNTFYDRPDKTMDVGKIVFILIKYY